MDRRSNEVRGWQSPVETWANLHDTAREFRGVPTPAESMLWNAVRNRKVAGARFRRQHAIDRYLVDFYCAEARLVVEVDGPVHDSQLEPDSTRQAHLERLGLTVVRFTNEEVLGGIDSVLQRIAEALSATRPLSEIGEGDGG